MLIKSQLACPDNLGLHIKILILCFIMFSFLQSHCHHVASTYNQTFWETDTSSSLVATTQIPGCKP
jgi:hypothetical protein